MRILIFALFVCTSAFAQTAQKEINEQVWKPFMKAFNEGNTELFMSVHSKDVVRSPRDGKEVLNWEQYNKQTADWNSKRTAKFNIELHFTERINNENQAIDVGIYKTTAVTTNDKVNVGYGRFHVVLRKENGTWKILVDTDSDEGRTIGEAQFLAARPME
jgi:ketosteroid isomerase-like protein